MAFIHTLQSTPSIRVILPPYILICVLTYKWCIYGHHLWTELYKGRIAHFIYNYSEHILIYVYV